MPSTPTDLEQTAITPADWLPGYELQAVVGAGGFGTVFQARQLKLDRPVAVKVVPLDKLPHPGAAARFAAEAVTLGRLHHPNIVQVFDCGRTDGRLFIVMELLEGEDLGQRLRAGKRLDERTTWSVVRQAALALAHAAAQGVVHRDIKPANLFLTPAPAGFGLPPGVPMVKVMDFGLAKWTATPADERLTATGVLIGTPVYMAPEQYQRADRIDHRADIYALGATAFHALAGRAPFAGSTVWDVMAQKLEHTPRFGPAIPPASAELIGAMMTKEVGDRIGSYEELIERIDRLPALRLGSTWHDAPRRGAARKRGWVWAAAATGVLAVAGVGAWAGRGAGPEPAQTAAQVILPAVVPTDDPIALFERSLNGWVTTGGSTWGVELDGEKTKVLAGSGSILRPFAPAEDYQLTLGLDVHTAEAAEVHFAITAANGPRFVLRVSKTEGAVFGTRDGDRGAFQPRAVPVPFPSAARLADRSPYLEVKVVRVGGRWAVWFDGAEAGRAECDGPVRPEVRLCAEGGRVRVEEVILTALQRK